MTEENRFLNGATIKDVARVAGVSVATVSRILNKNANVSEELTNRVKQAVLDLSYRPNNVARALKVRESRSIGLIIPDIENPYFPSLVRGAEDAAQKNNYAVMLCNTDGKPDEEKKYIDYLYSKQVDGIIFTGGNNSDKTLTFLHSLQIPAVILDRSSLVVNLSLVTADNRLGGRMAAEHLIACGRKNIALISGPKEVSSSYERKLGYLDALKNYGRPYNDKLVKAGAFTFVSGYEAMKSVHLSSCKFDAVFAANDLMAIGAIHYLRENKLRIPEDIAVVGYDDISMAAWFRPALTTVRQPVYEMGQMAVNILFEQIGKRDVEIGQHKFEPELIIRETSVIQEDI